MYGLCNATVVADTIEEVQRKVDGYRKYPHFGGGKVRSTQNAPKYRRQGKYMATLHYFNND